MRKIIWLSSIVLFLSCKNEVTEISSQEKNSDSVKIESLKKNNELAETKSFKNCNETF